MGADEQAGGIERPALQEGCRDVVGDRPSLGDEGSHRRHRVPTDQTARGQLGGEVERGGKLGGEQAGRQSVHTVQGRAQRRHVPTDPPIGDAVGLQRLQIEGEADRRQASLGDVAPSRCSIASILLVTLASDSDVAREYSIDAAARAAVVSTVAWTSPRRRSSVAIVARWASMTSSRAWSCANALRSIHPCARRRKRFTLRRIATAPRERQATSSPG